MGKKNAAINESTGQSGADTRSGSASRSASHSPTATLSVSFDAAKVRKDAETLVAEEEKSEKNLLTQLQR